MDLFDLAIDPITGDLLNENNDLSIVKGVDSLNQRLRQRLRFFVNEWFLDQIAGLPFYTDILIKTPNIDSIDSIIKAEIKETESIIEIIEYDSVLDSALRGFTVTFKARSEFGVVEFSETIFPTGS